MAAGKQESGGDSPQNGFGEVIERCERCNEDTLHGVSIRIAPVSTESRNPKYAREPCRTTQCQVCGERSTEVVNHT